MQTHENATETNGIGDTSGVETNTPGNRPDKQNNDDAQDSPVIDENSEPLNGDGLTKAEEFEQQAT